MEEVKEDKGQRRLDNWEVRRAMMLLEILFCMLVIGFVLWTGMESRVAETAVDFAFVLMGTIILAYVFGASWQDIALAKIRKVQ